ncbi:NAD(P)/FAD-dependent oxidoreductase [Vagococcus acidifermentans]|uniref:FAD dependent oxidoreductase domain-containing protein n=1 Tax=Vagococcus acidifermentans TaxID=564710 RepID=A0A430AVJ3_9ENTE|nr:FAD-binding oxidoreductase [Vagococcus acidifermentans]RSU12066.1 hypothetical protein CBF27_06475 [Vagococcus acidifermentans]
MGQRIAIIGGGIIGTTTAFYLSRNNQQVTLFDDGTGQATKAAAGIISPWLSQRRNKEWYALAKAGAHFYRILMDELTLTKETDSYCRTGTLLFKKNDPLLHKLTSLAEKRREDAPEIGRITRLTQQEITAQWPSLRPSAGGLHIAGGARVDGRSLLTAMGTQAAKSGCCIVPQKVQAVVPESGGYTVHTDTLACPFDAVVLAAGAWLPELLSPLGYQTDIRPQKGQLAEITLPRPIEQLPVIMPVGEIDIIPATRQKILVGATHENDMGYNLAPDPQLLTQMVSQAADLLPVLKDGQITGHRVGTRAYTSDFLPFFGPVAGLPRVYAAGGLGSSGLTTGTIIGKTLADWLLDQPSCFEHYRRQAVPAVKKMP